MTISIYAYRTLLWVARQESNDIPALMVPEEVLPEAERYTAHGEMSRFGWLLAPDKAVAGGPDFGLSSEGTRRARRWADDYLVHHAAYEVLHAVPTDRHAYLTSANEAFEESYQDPVIGEHPSAEVIDQAAEMLHKHELVTGEESHGHPPYRLELTPQGREVRREHQTPGISVPNNESATGTPTVNQYIANINGGTAGAVQVGQNNQATVGDVQSEVNQHFRTLRDLVSERPSHERQALFDQIDQLEAAAKRGTEEFESLKNRFFQDLVGKLGQKAAATLFAVSPLVTLLGG